MVVHKGIDSEMAPSQVLKDHLMTLVSQAMNFQVQSVPLNYV